MGQSALLLYLKVTTMIPMLLQNALSGARSETRATRNMTFRAINYVNPLAVDVNASIYILNGYSLFDCCNAVLVFECAPRRAKKMVPIWGVIKSLCRIIIPKLLEYADSVFRPDTRTRRNMTFRAINCVNPLAVDVNATIYILNGYSLLKCYNAVLVFGRISRRARR
jgi:uncharacterized protein YhhL (DUF1145 family)